MTHPQSHQKVASRVVNGLLTLFSANDLESGWEVLTCIELGDGHMVYKQFPRYFSSSWRCGNWCPDTTAVQINAICPTTLPSQSSGLGNQGTSVQINAICPTSLPSQSLGLESQGTPGSWVWLLSVCASSHLLLELQDLGRPCFEVSDLVNAWLHLHLGIGGA